MNPPSFNLELLDSVEVSLEYIIADYRTMRPRNIASAVLRGLANKSTGEDRSIRVSNTLTQHTLKFTSQTPQSNFHKLEADLVDSIQKVNQDLEQYEALLLPGGVHPFFDPKKEGELYEMESGDPLRRLLSKLDYHRHTWLNTQTAFFTIRYDSKSEFTQIHNAIVLLLPLIPAFSASSPYLNGDWQDCLDSRTYNQPGRAKKIPTVVGDYIPNTVSSIEEYQRCVLDPISDFTSRNFDLFSSSEIEKINCRAVVPLLSEKRIEIRVMGTQEAPLMDLAIIAFILGALKLLLRQSPSVLAEAACRSSPKEKKEQLRRVCKKGFDTPIDLVEIPAAFGLGNLPITVGNFHNALFERIIEYHPFEYGFDSIQKILREGSLAERLFRQYQTDLDNYGMKDMLFSLAKSLASNKAFPHQSKSTKPAILARR